MNTLTISPSDLIAPDDAQFAQDMLARIAFIRAFEAKALSLSQAKPPVIVGSIHLCAGQEAVPLAALATLRPTDKVIATYRGHGWALASGIDPKALLAELCHRAGGVNGGRGGSAYVMNPTSQFVGETSIVGAGTTIACGLALASAIQKRDDVSVVTIGDGALNQGSVHEAFAFAAAKKLPVVFVIENNGWSELTPTSDMFTVERLARRASGYGIPAATINGSDPIAIRDSFRVAVDRARRGEGPSFLEMMVPRLWGHYNLDIEHYRAKADRAAAEQRDPLARLADRLIASGIWSASQVETVATQQIALVEDIAREVIAMPLPNVDEATQHVVAPPIDRNDKQKPVEQREMTFAEAVNLAIRTELENDDRTVVYGEDVGKPGGIFGVSRYLQRDFGVNRVFDTPIAENAILGSAIGAALGGLKPIVEIMWADFLFVALDQLVNQASNVRYITGGASSVPMVVRTQQGVTPGSCAQHSQSIEAMLAHVPGLKVALASSAADGYALLRAAAADPDPCVIIESRALYQTKSVVAITSEAEPVGLARLRRPGKDIALISWGAMVERCVVAATQLEIGGVDAAVLDLRWLNPLDETALTNAVQAAGGRALIVHEAVRTGGFAGEIMTRIRELLPSKALNLRRLATPDVRIPASPILQASLLPNADTISAAALDQLKT
jgi:2-oxoisovalerate dehydrogenase E1 component